MKFIGPETGRVVQLFSGEEIRPLAGAYLPGVFAAIKARYEFPAPPPDPALISQPGGAKFSLGHLARADIDIGIIDLAVFNDGVIVTCTDTRSAETVSEDLIDLMVSEFKFRRSFPLASRSYQSTVVVEFNLLAARALGALTAVGRLVSAALSEQYEWNHRIDIQKLGWGADPLQIPAHRATQFVLERKLGIAFEQERYWTQAPLHIDKHLSLLKDIEATLLQLSK
jgi:hypothetical protein